MHHSNPLNFKGNVHLERHQAIALLREIAGLNLAELAAVYVTETKAGRFELILKEDCTPDLQKFIEQKT